MNPTQALYNHSQYAVSRQPSSRIRRRCSLWPLPLQYKQTVCSMLGSGHFSAVIAHPTEPSSKVVKIGMSIEDSWLGFAMYCKENPAPYLPVIEEIILFPKHYVAIMERLEPLNREQKTEWNEGKFERGDGANCVARIPESAAMFERLANERIDMHAENVMWRG